MRKVCVIQINVDDLDKAIDFYVDKLGFDVESMSHYPEVVTLVQPHLSMLLYKVDHAHRVDYPSVAQTMINIESQDIESDLAGLRDKGVELIHSSPVRCPVGRYAAVRDPAGNVLEIIEYDRREPGNVANN
jgi:lactoylglutathione lyase